MSEILRICGAAILLGIAAFLLRELGWRGAAAFSVFGAAVFFTFLADGLSDVAGGISRISELGGMTELAGQIMKILGASYIFGIASDICADLGEKTVASVLVAVGRVEIFLIALPYFIKIAEYAVGLVGA
jgi:stage III sporulation protein AD